MLKQAHIRRKSSKSGTKLAQVPTSRQRYQAPTDHDLRKRKSTTVARGPSRIRRNRASGVCLCEIYLNLFLELKKLNGNRTNPGTKLRGSTLQKGSNLQRTTTHTHTYIE